MIYFSSQPKIFSQVVTTRRSPSARSLAKSNNSSNSPFNDDDEEDRKARYFKDIRNDTNCNNLAGNGDIPSMNISQNENSNQYTNTNLSCHSYNESWVKRRNGGLKYCPDTENESLEPDIIPIKTQNCTTSLLPPDLSSKPFTCHDFKGEDEEIFSNTTSSGI